MFTGISGKKIIKKKSSIKTKFPSITTAVRTLEALPSADDAGRRSGVDVFAAAAATTTVSDGR